ncbi:AraC family transcriptional regulator [Ruminococcus flavefaciens]|jgi:AraC-like DNA-binding protein|uniref:AraC family transcriptional regulator n=1 Tax=Ruminococcus flavefaciens TaxID=1265 RepID=UPI0026F0CA67|nr:AraC family transcriptional regulator [Ruminococcus flavefaciens]MDD7516530.1 AraC family transcriptional regulator [Ruminococcus flavefaciens]MDY5691716.1 AraC family transcriptional regulator [Ruminococcus flavefaciens]
MIKNLSGDYETVEYENQRFVMLYDNDEIEQYPTHWHNAVEIIIPLHNGFTVTSGGVDYHLNEKEIIIIPPGELHSMPAQEGRRIIFQCDNSILSDIPALEAIVPVFTSAFHITPDVSKELYILSRKSILDIYSEYYSKSTLADVKIYIYLIKMLTAVREYQLTQAADIFAGDPSGRDDTRKFGMVMKYINQNYMYEIPLEKIASIAGYSKYHFSRIFKKYNHVSYIQYINSKRIKAAERLLIDPNLSVTEVAMRAGFASLTTFNRAFKKAKNCTPTEFKTLYKISDHQ